MRKPSNRAVVSAANEIENEIPFRRGPEPSTDPAGSPAGGLGEVVENADLGDETDTDTGE